MGCFEEVDGLFFPRSSRTVRQSRQDLRGLGVEVSGLCETTFLTTASCQTLLDPSVVATKVSVGSNSMRLIKGLIYRSLLSSKDISLVKCEKAASLLLKMQFTHVVAEASKINPIERVPDTGVLQSVAVPSALAELAKRQTSQEVACVRLLDMISMPSTLKAENIASDLATLETCLLPNKLAAAIGKSVTGGVGSSFHS